VPLLVEQGRALAKQAPDLLRSLQGHSAFQWADQKFDLTHKLATAARGRAYGVAVPLLTLLGGVASGIVATITILSLAIFALFFGRDLFLRGLEWVEPPKRVRIRVVAAQIHQRVGGYVVGTLVISLLGGVVTAIAMLFSRVPYFL